MSMETKGLRVVRGPDWKWGDQDGGEGCVGTVVAKGGKLDRMLAELAETAERAGLKPPDIGRRFGSQQSHQSEEGFVFVMWDSGSQADYRTGFKGAHDLRIVDSSLVGVKHTGFFCQWKNGENVPCNKEICGIRWRCTVCHENLCTGCFLRNKWLHDQAHTTFDRYDTPTANPVKIQVKLIDRIKLWGIFPNAEVIRGKDWRYGDEDDGAVGKVVTDRSWIPVPGKVRVKWGIKDPILYRRGFDGKVDLVAKNSTIGGQYQREWLPVLNTVLQSRKKEGSSSFVVGHRVRINAKVGQEDLRDKQAGSARWDPLMVKEIGKIGTVSRVDHDGDVHVEYKESGKKWCFNSAVLEKVSCYAVGQAVRVRDRGAAYDEMINELGQTGRKLAGKTGSVVDVTINGMVIIEDDQMQKSKPLKESWVEDVPLVSKMRKLELKLASLLVEASSDGDLSLVKNVSTKYSVSADETRDRGVTALHMASRNGHIEIVKYLMKDLGANPDQTDDRGRTAIYFAVKGRQAKVIEFLMDETVRLNLMTNNKKLTPLQKAVAKQSKECFQLLISNKTCDVNQVDEDGNTPLHNAAYRSRLKINDGRVPEIVKLLIECKRMNQSIRNKKGFNALHAAVSAGDLCVVNYLLANDNYGLGFEKVACTQTTSLHLACASKQYEVGRALVEYFEKKVKEPQPSSSSSPHITFEDLINAKDNNDHTPLMMACFKGAYGLVELLVNKGADIHSVDKDGDSLIILTALHMRRKIISQKARAAFSSIVNQSRSKAKRIPDETISPDIFKLYTHYMGDGNSNDNPMKTHPALSIVYFLIRNGCSWSASKNKTSKIVDDDFVMVSIESFALDSGQSTVDEDSSLASNGIQPDNRVEDGGSEVPKLALRSDVVPVKCDKISVYSNEIDNNNGQQQPIIITVLSAPSEVEQSYVTSRGTHENYVYTESTNSVDISLPTTGEEAGVGSAVYSQPILLFAQNASVQIPAPQPAAATIPTAVPPTTSSKVKKKVTVQVGDGGATQEWTLIEKGSRKETDLLVGPDENGYTKNGNRWLCTKAAPPKQEGGKNEKCPAKVQETARMARTK